MTALIYRNSESVCFIRAFESKLVVSLQNILRTWFLLPSKEKNNSIQKDVISTQNKSSCLKGFSPMQSGYYEKL